MVILLFFYSIILSFSKVWYLGFGFLVSGVGFMVWRQGCTPVARIDVHERDSVERLSRRDVVRPEFGVRNWVKGSHESATFWGGRAATGAGGWPD